MKGENVYLGKLWVNLKIEIHSFCDRYRKIKILEMTITLDFLQSYH